MSEKVDPKVIKKTQDTLGKIIKKPPLTEKLLSKPPFRFLHDIITSIIKTTGFMKDLFSDVEMSSEKIKDKESKIAFLQKAIDFITMVNGTSLSTNPNKVIAGHEATNTNEFLQALAEAIGKKIDNESSTAAKPTAKPAKSSAGKPSEERDRQGRDEDKHKRRSNGDGSKVKHGAREPTSSSSSKRDILADIAANDKLHRDKLAGDLADEKRDQVNRHRQRQREAEGDTKRTTSASHEVPATGKERKGDKGVVSPSKKAVSSPTKKLSSKKPSSSASTAAKVKSVPKSSPKKSSTKKDTKQTTPTKTKSSKPNNDEMVAKFNKKSDQPSASTSKKDKHARDSSAAKNASDKDGRRDDKGRRESRRDDREGRKDDRKGEKRREDKEERRREDKEERRREDKEERRREDKEERRREDKEDRRREDKENRKDDRNKKDREHRRREDREERDGKDRKDRSARRGDDREHKSRDDRRTSKDRGDRKSSKDHRSNRTDSERRSSRDQDSRKSARPKRSHHDEDRNNTDEDIIKDKKKAHETEKPSDEEEELNQTARIPRPSSAKGSRRHHGHARQASLSDEEELHRQQQQNSERQAEGEENKANEGNRSRLARPSSARPAPPKNKSSDDLSRFASKTVVQQDVGASSNLMVDRHLDTDSESDNDLAVDNDDRDDRVDFDAQNEPSNQDLNRGDHGGLVKGILEQKNTLEQGSSLNKDNKTQIERSSGINDAARSKDRRIIEKQIDSLRTSIQSLTRGVNPLGKMMDFVQEDLDAMRKELDVWKSENKINESKLKLEENVTESSIEPLQLELMKLDASISDEHEVIAAVKSNIIRNNDRITKMIASISCGQ